MPLKRIATEVKEAGGRALVVGGYVRDSLIGMESKDIDVEVYGLSVEKLASVLSQFGKVETVGQAFGVLMVRGLDMDFSIPRRDSKVGKGHKGFSVEPDPTMSVEDAARRRDLTMNSLAMDPLTGEILDPFKGVEDIKARRLRATDVTLFGDDPLRALRVVQFAARFEMTPDKTLLRLMQDQNLSELPAERLMEEFRKLLLKGRKPSLGLRALKAGGLLGYFPELDALVGCEQEYEWHPEGDVWTHTLMVVDEAALLRTGDTDHDLKLMMAALCHDLGKPATTTFEDGRIRSKGHEAAGEEPTRSFLKRLRFPKEQTQAVVALVVDHLAPALYPEQGTKAPGYRRLARRLGAAGASIDLLYKVGRADHMGRTTADALSRLYPKGEQFLREARDLEVEVNAPKDVVLGRHLIARGMEPGRHFGELLAKCREVQDETGLTDPETILTQVLG